MTPNGYPRPHWLQVHINYHAGRQGAGANASHRSNGGKHKESQKMLRNSRKLFFFGGLIASLVLFGFGAAMIVIGYQGRDDVRSTLAREQIYGPTDSTIPGQLVDTGDKARAQADIMRHHTLTATGGLTYAQMGSYQLASDPTNPKGTSDKTLAAKDANGNPIANAARNTWVTETALTTALNTAYFAENVGNFAMITGVALMLTGAGFTVLTFGALRVPATADDKKRKASALTLADNPS